MTTADPSLPRRYLTLIAAAAAVFAVDQLTKEVALRTLADGSIELLGSGLRLHLTFNPGGIFGIMGGASTFFLIATLAVSAGIVIGTGRVTDARWLIPLGAVLGGGLGNAYDRLFRGFDGRVVDFIDVGWWPVFNLADVAIVCGGLAVFLLGWRASPESG